MLPASDDLGKMWGGQRRLGLGGQDANMDRLGERFSLEAWGQEWCVWVPGWVGSSGGGGGCEGQT